MTTVTSTEFVHIDERADTFDFQVCRAEEKDRLLRWLDDGLRDGRRGRLEAEYGLVLSDDHATRHMLGKIDGRFVSHALVRSIDVRAGGVKSRIGMIGLVYTDPAFRRRGFAAQCIRACETWLEGRGVAFSVLWSDRHDWYARLGYHLNGFERTYTIDPDTCARALRELGFDGVVSRPDTDDWNVLSTLYRQKPSCVDRKSQHLRSLASGPDCRLVVARRAGGAVAYAVLGRGDDFPGVVHEWAGEPGGVVACLSELLTGRESLDWMAGPGDEPPEKVLRDAGAPFREGGFALTKPLRPEALWYQLAAGSPALRFTHLRPSGEGFRLIGPRGTSVLAGDELSGLLLGRGERKALDAMLPSGARGLSATPLPWPLFIWGFDSI